MFKSQQFLQLLFFGDCAIFIDSGGREATENLWEEKGNRNRRQTWISHKDCSTCLEHVCHRIYTGPVKTLEALFYIYIIVTNKKIQEFGLGGMTIYIVTRV